MEQKTTEKLKTKFREKKSFYPVRHYRLSDKIANWLNENKKGTWNFTFNQLKRVNKKSIWIKKQKTD